MPVPDVLDHSEAAIAWRAVRWPLLAQPMQHLHPDWQARQLSWPAHLAFTEAALAAPESLYRLLQLPMPAWLRTLQVAGLLWYAPALRRVIGGRERQAMERVLGSALMSLVLDRQRCPALPDAAAATACAPLWTDGVAGLLGAGARLLLPCSRALCGGLHQLAIWRLPDTLEALGHAVPPLARQAVQPRLDWLADVVGPFSGRVEFAAFDQALTQDGSP